MFGLLWVIYRRSYNDRPHAGELGYLHLRMRRGDRTVGVQKLGEADGGWYDVGGGLQSRVQMERWRLQK
jgi:hypothetical protein